MFVCCGGGGGKQPRTTTRPVRAEASSRLTVAVAHDTLNQTRGPGGVFFVRSHCGARNVKLEYISVGYSKTRDPTKAVTHTHTNIHTHTHNSGCISHHTPTWFVVLLRYCMKVNQNGRAFYEIKYSMGPTPKNNFFHFFVVVYTCRVSLCSILSIRVGILVSGDVAEQDDFRWGWKGEPGRKQV
jgi:hypothetical protein